MQCTLAFIWCSITLVSLCNGAYKSALYIKYSINRGQFTPVFPDSKPVIIKYKKGDSVELICSITDKTIHNSKEPYLSWVDDQGFKSTPSQIYQINYTKLLEDSDDQTNLVCKAESKELKETWEITTNFVRIKSPEEVLKAKFANRSFFILLISILALILVPIAFLLIYAAIRKCMKKRGTNACTDETPLENQTVVYSEILENEKSNDPPAKGDDPLYAKIRIENLSSDSGVHNPSYVKFDRPDSCVTDNHARNDNQSQIGVDNDDVNGNDTCSGNRKFSSDC